MLIGYWNAVISTEGRAVQATITVYYAGTKNKAPIYADRYGTVKDNPFQTDSYGRFQFFVEPGIYDIEVSGEGVTSYTLENIPIGNAVPFVTPEDFGAVGDGTTDDTEAIQAALDKKRAVLLKSKYLVTAPIETKESVIIGEGVNTGLILSGNGYIKITHSHAGLENMSIETKAGWSAEQAVLVEPNWNLTNNFIRDIFFYAKEGHTSAAAVKLGSADAGSYGIMNITIDNIRTFDFGTVILFHRGPSWMSGGIIRNIFAGRAENIIVCEGEDYIPAFTLFENIHGQYYATYTTQLFKDFAGKNCTIINPELWDGGKFGNFSTKSRFNLILGGHGGGNLPEDWVDEGYKNSYINFYPAYGSYTRSRFWEFQKALWTSEDRFFGSQRKGVGSIEVKITPVAPKLNVISLKAGDSSNRGAVSAYTDYLFPPYIYWVYRIRFKLEDTSDIAFFLGVDSGDGLTLSSSYIGLRGESNFEFVTSKAGIEHTFDTGKAIDTSWHELQISYFNAGRVIFFFDGNLIADTSADIPNVNMRIVNRIESTVSGEKEMCLTDLFIRHDVRLS